jgi:anti-sigma regulatory factor (Ser/Thr protein kinase)
MSFQAGRTMAAPRLARQALSEWLASVACPDEITHDAVLVVSELTTNAVLHAGSAAKIVASFDDGRLRVEVHDQERTPPRIRHQADANGGWGLRLVAAVVDGWGWMPTPAGKQVWAEMLC